MNPWLIISGVVGWTLVLLLAIFVYASFRSVGRAVRRAYIKWRDHRRSRVVAPAVGQIWEQGGTSLYIRNVYEDGGVGMSTYHPRMSSPCGASWRDSPQSWAERVKNRRLVLVGNWKDN